MNKRVRLRAAERRLVAERAALVVTEIEPLALPIEKVLTQRARDSGPYAEEVTTEVLNVIGNRWFVAVDRAIELDRRQN